MAYWLGNNPPVIVILVRPNGAGAYWEVITPRTAKETGGSFTVTVPASQEFAAAARDQLEAIAARPGKPPAGQRRWVG